MTVLHRALGRLRRVRPVRDQTVPGPLFPPGHFYSPIPDLEEVRRDSARIFDRSRRSIPGIDLREDEQFALLERFVPYYQELPFGARKTPECRYWFENPMYSYADAICLYGMMRHLRPKRVIEVGSGFTSAVILDTSERFLANAVSCTFIEPHATTLRQVLDGFPQNYELLERRVQEVPPEFFQTLEANDILLIDSTHVSKPGSDVNFLLFDVLPRLQAGVHIHFHDVFYPFEYPAEWIDQGYIWNEDYLLRAFLQFNSAFDIVLFNTFLEQFHEPWFAEHLPLCLKNPGGSLWIRRAP